MATLTRAPLDLKILAACDDCCCSVGQDGILRRIGEPAVPPLKLT